jgi:hypothetical protein
MSALQHVCLGRGDTSRGFNLCDIFTLMQDSIGPTECVMLGLVTDRGKSNKVKLNGCCTIQRDSYIV